MKQGKGYQGFAKRVHWSQQTLSSNNTRDVSTHGHHQMVDTEVRLIIFFAAEDGKALYSIQITAILISFENYDTDKKPNSHLGV